MNTWQRKTTRLIAGTTASIVVATITFVGCRVDYGDLGGGSDFLDTARTLSFFSAVQIDPRSEDSAGPQFVVSGDLNGDGLMDLVSAWDQSQPVQIHLQGRTAGGGMSFETLTLAGSIPAVAVAGLAIADFDQDGRPDIAVLIKESLLVGAGCLDSEQISEGLQGLVTLYLGPTDSNQVNQALAWQEVRVEVSLLQGEGDTGLTPEIGGYTSMAVGDMDVDEDMDIVVAWNSTCGGGTRSALIFTNNGPGPVRDGTWAATGIPDSFPTSGSHIKDVALGDIDDDGDLDVVATFPDALTMNVRWYRNPVIDIPDDYHLTGGGWQVGMISQIATGADVLACVPGDTSGEPGSVAHRGLGDIDGDGIVDVVVRSTNGGLIQWLRGPEGPTTSPLRAIPWQVYTIAEFPDLVPQALALGDLNFDGRLDAIIAASGGMAWFNSAAAASVYDQWTENLIIDSDGYSVPSTDPTAIDPNVDPAQVTEGTSINSILFVDLDGNGANDFVATLDRHELSGLSNDAIAWFRNTQRPPG
jgi:hypothetical protein